MKKHKGIIIFYLQGFLLYFGIIIAALIGYPVLLFRKIKEIILSLRGRNKNNVE